MSHKQLAQKLWEAHGLSSSFLESYLHLSRNPDPVVDSTFKLGSVAQTAIGLAALSASYLHYLRTGEKKSVNVDARHAVLEFKSEAWYTVDGQIPPGEAWDSIAGLYPTKDGRMVRLHTNFPHHRSGILALLGLPTTPTANATRADVSTALSKWDAFEFETRAAEAGMCVTAMRTFEEWDKHSHAVEAWKAGERNGPVKVRRIGEGAKWDLRGGEGGEGCGKGRKPLEGVKVLDLSRVLAGPVCGRTLAEYGAQTLLITSPHLPSLPLLDTDTSRGKRTAQLDLTLPQHVEKLKGLVQGVGEEGGVDVFLQAYRPGALEGRGFGMGDVVGMVNERRGGLGESEDGRGIVYANLSAWGWDGPWKDRRGFDSLVQTAIGFNHAEGLAFATALNAHSTEEQVPVKPAPRPLPMQALDHAAGYLLAFGINVALCRRITEGGSWEVQVSLLSVANWIRSLGQLDPHIVFSDHINIPPFPSTPSLQSTPALPRRLKLPERTIPSDPELAPLMGNWVRREPEGDSAESESGGKKMTLIPGRVVNAIKHAAILSTVGAESVSNGALAVGVEQGDGDVPSSLDGVDGVAPSSLNDCGEGVMWETGVGLGRSLDEW